MNEVNERMKYPDIPMTENDWELCRKAGKCHYTEWTKIDLTKAESREGYDKLKNIAVRLYHDEESDF